MYGVAVEYASTEGGIPEPLERGACRATMVGQSGYRRRLALMADGWRRIIDLFLFASPEAARAALAGETWRDFAAAHPACRAAAPALLVSEGHSGGPVVMLRQTLGRGGGQACWRDHLTATESLDVLW